VGVSALRHLCSCENGVRRSSRCKPLSVARVNARRRATRPSPFDRWKRFAMEDRTTRLPCRPGLTVPATSQLACEACPPRPRHAMSSRRESRRRSTVAWFWQDAEKAVSTYFEPDDAVCALGEPRPQESSLMWTYNSRNPGIGVTCCALLPLAREGHCQDQDRAGPHLEPSVPSDYEFREGTTCRSTAPSC
jgi:hypothetical protein